MLSEYITNQDAAVCERCHDVVTVTHKKTGHQIMKSNQIRSKNSFNYLSSYSVIAALLVGVNAEAANITWGSAQNIAADTDVSLNGTLVRAANLTPLLPNTTLNSGNASFTTALNTAEIVNGVTFAGEARGIAVANAFTLLNGDVFLQSDSSRTGPSTSSGQFAGFGGPNSSGTPANAPFNALNSISYQRMLSTAWWNDGFDATAATTSRYTVTLNNLSLGNSYELQLWVSDARLNNVGQNNPGLFVTLSDGVTSVDLQNNVNDVLGGIGQYVIGTFTADATSQIFTFTGGNTPGADLTDPNVTAIMNAYQIRDITPVPEPTTFGLVSLGMASLVMLRRRS
jgi:hypothetical protein